jgi:hypothetical protein
MDDLWHSEAQRDWLYGFGDQSYDEATGRLRSFINEEGFIDMPPNRFDDLFARMNDAHPNLQEFAERFVDSFDEVYQYRLTLQEAFESGGKLPSNGYEWTLRAVLEGIAVAPPTRETAFRAMRVTPEEAQRWAAGSNIDLPVSSFSYNQNEVWQFMGYAEDMGFAPTEFQNVMLVLSPGARALPMGAITTESAAIIGEVATAGTFRVTSATTKTAPSNIPPAQGARPGTPYLEVTVEQVAPFAVEEIGSDVFVRSVGKSPIARTTGEPLGVAPSRPANMMDQVAEEIMSADGMQYTRASERLEAIPAERRNFAEILYRQGFDGMPNAVPTQQFRAFMGDDDYVTIFRGIRGGEATRGASLGQTVDAEQAAFDFISGDLYPSGGTAGSGAYFTTDGSGAITYSVAGGRSGLSSQPGAVVAAVLPKNANIFDYRTAGSEFFASMRREGFEDVGEYLAAQGYDAIRFGGWDEPTLDIAVLNRSALTVLDEPMIYRSPSDAPMRAERLGGGNIR